MTRIKRDSIAYLVIVGFCLIMLAWAIPTYTPEYPGYGASPALVSNVAVGIMLFMASLSLIRIGVASYRNKLIPVAESEFPEDLDEESSFTQIGRVNLYHLTKIMIPCILLVVVIDYIGYLLTAFTFLMILQFAIGSRQWVQPSILSIILTGVLYAVMRYGFGVPVPGPQIF